MALFYLLNPPEEVIKVVISGVRTVPWQGKIDIISRIAKKCCQIKGHKE